MVDWLVTWGVTKATGFVFRPILEDLAKDVAKDAAKSYVGKCFKNVFSVIHRKPLTKATGLAVKELLELIESELIGADVTDDGMKELVPDVKRFIKHENIQQALADLFLDPDYKLDPKVFAKAWQSLENANSLPPHPEFFWERIAKRFVRLVEGN